MSTRIRFIRANPRPLAPVGGVGGPAATPDPGSAQHRKTFGNPGAGKKTEPVNAPEESLYVCQTVGCHGTYDIAELLKRGDKLRHCPTCVPAVRAALEGGEYLDDVLTALRRSSPVPLTPPLPDSFRCMACKRRTALPQTLWCSTKCSVKVRGLCRRQMHFVALYGLVLPEKAWWLTFGIGESTYRARRQRIDVVPALLLGAPPRVERNVSPPSVIDPVDDIDTDGIRRQLRKHSGAGK